MELADRFGRSIYAAQSRRLRYMVEWNAAVRDEELRQKPSCVLPAVRAGNRAADDDDHGLLVVPAIPIPVAPIEVSVNPYSVDGPAQQARFA